MEKREMDKATQSGNVAGTDGAAFAEHGADDGASPAAKDRIHELSARLRDLESDRQKERDGLMGHIHRLEGRMEEMERHLGDIQSRLDARDARRK